jgi:saccharopine dehydrogenase (NAD+, L-lysine-forming)
MKVMILGHGAVGSVLVRLLSKEKSVSSIICGDISFAGEKKLGKIHFKKTDLSNEKQLLEFFNNEKADLVVNAASPVFNEKILGACVKARLNYMDMASRWDPNPDKKAKSPYKLEQFDFDRQFKEKGIMGLIEAGVSPGITNLLARECSEQLDETDTIKIRLLDYAGTDELTFSWSKEALLDEITSKPVIYENGKFRIMEPFSGEEEFDYPAPFGKRKATLICQEEIGTIPFFIKVKNADIKDYDNQVGIHKLLYKLGLISKKKIKIGKIELSPFDFMCKVLPEVTLDFSNKKYDNAQFGLVVEADGKKNGKRKRARYTIMFPKQKDINKLKINANFISYPTALSAKAFILSTAKIKQKGIFPPETLSKEVRDVVLNELRKNKIMIHKTEK